MIQSGNFWHLWRKRGVGSSDSACLFDESPYKSKDELRQEKLGAYEPKVNEFIVNKGKRLEPRIRALYELQYGGDFPDETAELKNYPFIRCSFDGYQPNKIVEIKFVGKKAFESLDIPSHHFIQIQHQLLVSGASYCHYVKYNDKADDIHVTEVWPNPNFICELYQVERQFWESLVEGYKVTNLGYQLFSVYTSQKNKFTLDRGTYLWPNCEPVSLEGLHCQDIIQLDHAKWLITSGSILNQRI